MFDFEIIDSHIHPFVDLENNLSYYGTPHSFDEMAKMLKEIGISKACGSIILNKSIDSFEAIRKCNRDVLMFQRLHPDFYRPGISIHADFPEESCRELEIMYTECGVRWIGELVSYMVGTENFSCTSLYPVFDLAQKLGMPVNVHQANLADIEKVVQNFPALKLVMAHPGEKYIYTARVNLMKQYPNLYLDISGTGIFRWGMLKYGVDEVGPERFLFGTDFPVCNAATYIHGVLAEKLGKKAEELIFAGNFRRLTGYK